MVKVLIYSSKEIYETAPFEGRAEADLIAYAKDEFSYEVLKNKQPNLWLAGTGEYGKRYVKRWIKEVENNELDSRK